MNTKNLGLISTLTTTLASTLALVLMIAAAPRRAQADDPGQATLPLAEILRLYKEAGQKEPTEKEKPPIAAAIHRLELVGRLGDDAIEVNAKIELSILEDAHWVELPLFAKDGGTSILALQKSAGIDGQDPAVFSNKNGWLTLVAKGRGPRELELSFRKKAEKKGRARRVELEVADATLAVTRLVYDAERFIVGGAGGAEKRGGTRGTEGLVIVPTGSRFVIEWEEAASGAAKVIPTIDRPPVEPIVISAVGQSVSTLEGRQILRAVYELRFEGQRTIQFTLPSGHSLEKVFVHRSAVPFEQKGDQVEITLSPARAGETAGAIELVLVRDAGRYNLSGSLAFEAPRASWPTQELYFEVFLPAVFNYEWRGGSLSPAESRPGPVFSYDLPLPGKKSSYHQYLIASSAPHMKIDYTFDLSGKYFR